MDMNLMHSNCMLNYSKSSSYCTLLICLVEVKSKSLIPDICRFQNSKLPSVHADVFFQQQNVSNLLIAVYRKCNFTTLRMLKISVVKVRISFESHWDCFDAMCYVGRSLSKCLLSIDLATCL